jgi:hypothetical protein
VQQAYRDRHRGELSDVYDTDLTWVEKLRWARARLFRRLEELPPFWTTYGLTVTAARLRPGRRRARSRGCR